VLLGLCSLLVFGQDNPQNNQTNQSRRVVPPIQVIVAGCLRKGTEPGRFYVTDEHGRTWELSSKKVDLAAQLFHVVSVSGHPTAVSKTQEGQSEQSQKSGAGSNQYFALDVVELTMLSNSCTR